jgi:acyl carrier protein
VSPAAESLASIRALVIRVAGASRAPERSGAATPLSDGGFWLDSVELLELVVACEDAFGITFDATRDFDAGAFATLGTLAALVDEKRAAARVGS